MTEPTGLIFDIQRFSIHDGPGIRTTVFLKGCPLRCRWCHNPESGLSAPQLGFYKAKCMGCGRCLEACPNGAIAAGDARIVRASCQVCGACAKSCPTEALRVMGRVATLSEVIGVVMRDEPFYKTSGGGATLSGGEPLLQHGFSLALLRAFKENGLHTAIETSGLGPWEKLAALAEFTDLIMYDLKAVDPAKHKALCGVENEAILSNARQLAESSASIIFRAPLVPGVNDGPEDLRQLGEFILSLPGKQSLEIMPYHRIGSGKYEALGLEYTLPETAELLDTSWHADFLAAMGVNIVGT